MNLSGITEALEARLDAWADKRGFSVAWTNIPFEPPVSGIYLTSHDMPAEPYSIDLAGTAFVQMGVYQVNVVTPAGSGKSRAKEIAGMVSELFPENLEIIGDGVTVWVDSPAAIFSGITDAVSYTIPVSIRYRVHISL